ncbi:bifunctional hydroxymethylpyrimidine kinase/phosphomethylpyrimidine kinase [Rhodoblastus acidophilus]|uniref:hydroxymethylpyrimidine kinase n=1 Tax=Candidatus Rhodoblastus alkanivorans TaxID=2954117 RepID=A0ABS9ZBI2_9HYPH|nr:bifunctional hydroxymethylpyrimidine kinase/phosphomethylpyrimidine kinase [Candidatus Rhodoblastus alkanivorans]MCI4677812.1 bifunctional hydroxymethylpyrimidine kinase/phosphomethylpyrimidine kinase [Candidatus Rhodoblastus alkanivorans]MCI4684690.1 bifunctional hydroxymethylpyrimidine kinase/phosphomethylpyrimidine kinase [Candidatus Rhodoblastus alkanivorans]MDI4642012.1 bifunctional hydroxymethylpyrimidine kinase/phosphomethylpyrimidine kinase [Rhodoblastus acidophilus]
MTPVAKILSIAGSDPSGGAGAQGDIKTFSALGCYGMAALTALTAQNTLGVQAVQTVPADFVAAEIDSVFCDIAVDAVKIGMIGSRENVAAIADRLRRHQARNVVLDPVLVASGGHSLGGDDLVAPIREQLFPLARLVTPNLMESALFAGDRMPESPGEMRAIALKLHALGAHAVLVKGGHLPDGAAYDLLYDGAEFTEYEAARVVTRNTHGTGCALSSAIAARLGQGAGLKQAIADAKAFLSAALEAGATLEVGAGHGPPNHFFALWGGAVTPGESR